MAKIKNRDKRKKAAVKKANQVKAGKPEMYEGYLKIPLDNSFTADEVRNRTEYFDEWLDIKKRKEILESPRKFVVTGHVCMADGEMYCATIDYQGYGDRRTIPDAANMAFDAARNGSGAVIMSKSYVVVRAQKDMSKFPKEIDIEAIKAEQQKKAPVMGLVQPYDYEYLWDEFTKEAKA